MTVFDCPIIYMKKLGTEKGFLSVAENTKDFPFSIKRVFYIYDIPGGESRGGHVHKECHEFLIAASGAFEILLDDGKTKRLVQLNRPYMGLHLLPGVWAAEINFSSGSVCLVLTSHEYDEDDYIKDYSTFLEWKGTQV
jgi:hypothetical protein